MKLLIKGGRIVDPASGRDEAGDVFIADGKISGKKEKADHTIDARGLVVAPGLIDLSARLREPGFEYILTPKKVGKLAGFMHRAGTLKNKAASWKYLFFEEAHGQPGD